MGLVRTLSGAAALALASNAGSADEWPTKREPPVWGCTSESVDLAARAPGAIAAIPPAPLGLRIGDLRLGRAFPRGSPHNISLAPDEVTGAERMFCSRDESLICPGGDERERLATDLARRSARIVSQPAATAAQAAAAEHVSDDLRLHRMPIVVFNSAMKYGPTAGVLRFRDERSRRWILGIALARDFVTAHENDLFLDGVLVQEMVHYDDLAYLPDPMRCFESNLEIRGHYAMMEFWKGHRHDTPSRHPRIQLALHASLDSASSRSTWYGYLNRVEKTDFRVEDELVSLEFHALPALGAERREDERFLGEIARIVAATVGKANYVHRNVAALSGDSIDVNARTISAVSRLVPRLLRGGRRRSASRRYSSNRPSRAPTPSRFARRAGTAAAPRESDIPR